MSLKRRFTKNQKTCLMIWKFTFIFFRDIIMITRIFRLLLASLFYSRPCGSFARINITMASYACNCHNGWSTQAAWTKRKKERKAMLKMASYACKRHHRWRMAHANHLEQNHRTLVYSVMYAVCHIGV